MNTVFSRRDLIKFGGLAAAGSLFIPTLAFADNSSGSNESIPVPSCRFTVEDSNGNILLSKEGAGVDNLSTNARSGSSNLCLYRDMNTVQNSDGTVVSSCSARLAMPTSGSARNIGSDTADEPSALVKIEVTYSIIDPNIQISKAVGTVYSKASFASIQGRSMAVSQGLIGQFSKDATFSTQSHTIVTNWDYCPYQPTMNSMFTHLNGGECVGVVYVSGMGETYIRANWVI